MKAIIWGVKGQDGYYLKELLQQKDIKVIGIGRTSDTININISDYNEVCTLIESVKPEYIFHLAANSTTQHFAWKENHETIAEGTLNILEAVKEYSPNTKVFLSGSGLQFKNTGLPIKETNPFDASSIYSATRIYSVFAARFYRTLGLRIYIGYFFNHDSPRRSERHINKKIILTAKRISEGSDEYLSIGKKDVQKEFGYAGDIVKAIWLLVNQDNIYETVIGTGKAYSIEEWIKISFLLFDLDWTKFVKEEKDFEPEYMTLVSDPSTIFNLGWRPETSISELAKMMS